MTIISCRSQKPNLIKSFDQQKHGQTNNNKNLLRAIPPIKCALNNVNKRNFRLFHNVIVQEETENQLILQNYFEGQKFLVHNFSVNSLLFDNE